MKIEKLTENKIRVIIPSSELGETNINVHNLMTKALETQDVFSDILKKAEKEVDFHTDGCKLLIEAFSSLEDVIVFTITKYLPDKEVKSKKLTVKRKCFYNCSKQIVCQFDTFDIFCEFCNNIKNLHKLNTIDFVKKASLYFWKNSYYLVLKNVNSKCENKNMFYASLSEFGKVISVSDHFESKLLEHGKAIIKKDAIFVGVRFFTED